MNGAIGRAAQVFISLLFACLFGARLLAGESVIVLPPDAPSVENVAEVFKARWDRKESAKARQEEAPKNKPPRRKRPRRRQYPMQYRCFRPRMKRRPSLAMGEARVSASSRFSVSLSKRGAAETTVQRPAVLRK